ncbi:pirin family protein [Massilia scottii]|uniref:pirin family protein n=1 Tax=Massilia scottii TaxID=3057166 RepID=UPI0027968DC8|nr:pirin-like C-terminal cupin domain-containing protein [Massilia sp. CCM 9029]MDQ1831831.1 pirin-like C-terminal cupin domain-containing protein [Massilia sp. CCM 9029]
MSATVAGAHAAPRPLLGMRTIEAHRMGEGLFLAKLNPSSLGWALDPFLQVDRFRMRLPFFPPHPHAGFSAVTFMLPQSPGGLINRDSLGSRHPINPGDLHWTEAARGIVHEEVPQVDGADCLGLQIFVNLPSQHKLAEPAIHHVARGDVPVVELAGATVHCYVGDLGRVKAALTTRTASALWTVELKENAVVNLPLPPSWMVHMLVTAGAIRIGDALLEQGGVAGYAAGTALEIQAATDGASLVVLAGLPLAEPIAVSGPFVMNDAAQLVDAKRRYARGEMGYLAAS